MRTLIAVPCMDQVAAPFAQSLATMTSVGETVVSFQIGSLIYEARNNFCKQALKLQADYVLWLDSDMIFPADLMSKMMAHMEEGKDIVSGLYFRRRAPFTPVLFSKLDVDENGEGVWKDYDDYPRDTTFEVEGIGMGCCLMRTAVIEDMLLNDHDWFTPFAGFGEDLAFSIRARRLGYKIHVDSTIKCGHVGQVIVDERIWDANREDSNA